MKIKDLIEEDKPREKLKNLGVDKLTNTELLAILLRTGTAKESCLALAQTLLGEFDNDLTELSNASIAELCEVAGIGTAKACTVQAIFALSRRLLASSNTSVTKLDAPERVARFLSDKFSRITTTEEFLVICLDSKNNLKSYDTLHKGSVNKVDIYPKEVFRFALKNNATSIIIAHNHPTGDLTPSEQDIKLTKRLQELADKLEIKLLDHLIIGGNLGAKPFFFSFNDEGYL